jgi:aryl-alcohol dehydrogenase-like predicted oxidoreductase
VQLGLSLLDREAERDLLPACREFGLGAVAFSPLASGLLTGKYSADQPFPAGSRLAEMPEFTDVATRDNLRLADAVRRLAQGSGVRPTALALSWVAAQAGVASVLAGATSAEQVRQNAADVSYRLDGEEVAALNTLLKTKESEMR